MKFGKVEELIGGAAEEEPGNPVEADDSENLCVCGNRHEDAKESFGGRVGGVADESGVGNSSFANGADSVKHIGVVYG